MLIKSPFTEIGTYLIFINSSVSISTDFQASGQQGRAASRAELRVVCMVAVMIASFLLAWTPYAIVSLVVTFGNSVSPSLAIIPALIAKSSTCYNPIIYVGLNTQVNTVMKKPGSLLPFLTDASLT